MFDFLLPSSKSSPPKPRGAAVPDASTIFVSSLSREKVQAFVMDFDHYRIGGGLAVETDYIIQVKSTDGSFDDFRISKTYSAFRSMASALNNASEKKLKEGQKLTVDSKHIIKFSQTVFHLIDSQRTQYLGKVNYTYVKSMARQRSQVINDTLDTILRNFPKNVGRNTPDTVQAVAKIIETFFLTDYVEENDFEKADNSITRFLTPSKSKSKSPHKKTKQSSNDNNERNIVEDGVMEDTLPPAPQGMASPVVPLSRKVRRPLKIRTNDDQMLKKVGENANLFFDDARTQSIILPTYSYPTTTAMTSASLSQPNKLTKLIGDNSVVFAGIAIISVIGLKSAAAVSITLDLDVTMLLAFSFFCFGVHIPHPAPESDGATIPAMPPRPSFVQKSGTARSFARSASFTIRRSMLVSPKTSFNDVGEHIFEHQASAEVLEGEDDPLIRSPMLEFPKGAALGSHLNCWSQPTCTDFKVRGQNYLQDRKKIPSGPFLFPARGVDLFLTDTCPENVGSNSGVLGGELRTKPTFLINFRLPWGVLIFYFEIPDLFLPFIRQKYEFEYDGDVPDLSTMTAGERAVCRFLVADQEGKDAVLKIVPIVVAGPWIVKSIVGGKPAILGTKLPVNYVYQKPEGNRALYLEADLDIVASSAARGILSVCRSHTQSLTLDLGFVVQGNQEDELPEQMLVAVRCHGIDPLNAPPLPPMKNTFLEKSLNEDVGAEE